MTLQEIIKAVDDGKKVFWGSDNYPVILSIYGTMITSNSLYTSGCNVPLSFAYGSKDFEPETFYIKD